MVTNRATHLICLLHLKSDVVSDDNDNDDLDSHHDDDSDDEIKSMEGDQFENFLQRVFSESCWAHIPRKFAETIPQDINGDCVFVLNAQSRSKHLEKCPDARTWKCDSKTKWKNFNNVRYRNCSGSHKCLNEDWEFKV